MRAYRSCLSNNGYRHDKLPPFTFNSSLFNQRSLIPRKIIREQGEVCDIRLLRGQCVLRNIPPRRWYQGVYMWTGEGKNGQEITKLASQCFFPSLPLACCFFGSICIYYDSSRLALLCVLFALLRIKRDIIS
jgi:hypothetical protein